MINHSLVIRILHSMILVSFILASVLIFNPVHAQQSTPSDDEVNAIAGQLYCPICENTPLDVCPTTACHDWRELIRQMLAQGKTPAEIKQYFFDHYGARVLSEPPRVGFGLLIYVVPLVAIPIGAFFLIREILAGRIISKKLAEESAAASQPAEGDEYASRLEAELQKRN